MKRLLFYSLFFCGLSAQAQTFTEKEEVFLSTDSAQVLLEREFYAFKEQFLEYATGPHPPDTLGPCGEYSLRWRRSAQDGFDWISRGTESTACSVRISVSSYGSRTVGRPVGDRYYLVICGHPADPLNVSIDYYVREALPAAE